MHLHVFSEEPDLPVLIPSACPRHEGLGAVVCGNEVRHDALFLFPPQCPRLAVWADEQADECDAAWLREQTSRRVLLVIDASWSNRVAEGRIYRYQVARDSFSALAYSPELISKDSVQTLSCDCIDNLPQAMMHAGAMLAIVGSLSDFSRSIEDSSLNAAMLHLGVESLAAAKTISLA